MSGELWSTNNKVGHASLDPPKWTFSEDRILSQAVMSEVGCVWAVLQWVTS